MSAARRVAAAIAIASADAAANAEAGRELRSDGFFDSTEGLRSDADEILEGLLLHAANAYQERKLRHLGAILPSLAVRPEISAADGHWLSLLADRLTWRQLVALSVFHDPPTGRFSARDVDRDEGAARGPAGSMRDEIEELRTFGLLGVTDSNGDILRATGTMGTMASIWGAPSARGNSRPKAGCSRRWHGSMPCLRPTRARSLPSCSCRAGTHP